MDPLVSVTWLAKHLDDPDVVLLDATLPPVGVVPAPDVRARYLEEHLPGAVFFDIDELSDRSTPLPHMLPAPEVFADRMESMGVGSDKTLVVYEQEGPFSAPRAWWMLRTFGVGKVYVLDGGLRAWKATGQPLAAGKVTRPAAMFQARLQQAAVRSFAEVRELLERGEQVLDARSAGRFAGTAPEPRAGLSSGHMPGASSLPFTEIAAGNGHYKSREELCTLFGEREVDLTQPVTTTCGSGVTAAVLALALERCGAAQVGLYDGSWAEYAQHPEAVIVRSGETA